MSGVARPLAAIFFCVLAEAFFSGAEMAIVSSRWTRVRRRAEEGDLRSRLLVSLWKNPDRLLATTLVGTNLAVVTASVLATALVFDLLRGGAGPAWRWLVGREELAVLLCLTPVTLFFGEMLPKSLFQGDAERMARRAAFPVALAWVAFYPVTGVLTVISGFLRRAWRSRLAASPFVTREELAMVVKLRDLSTDLTRHERSMIRRSFSFRETRARDVMVPLVRVAAFEENDHLEQVLASFETRPFACYPVFRRKTFNVVGVLDAVSCLREANLDKRIGRLMAPPFFVPENRSVVDLLRDMERQGTRLAVVVDEYGGATGIVTREDILEEVVGELQDEHEVRRGGVRRVDAATWEVDAHLGLEHLAETTGVSFPAGDYETPAGLMISILGRIPAAGDQARAGNLVLTAVEVSERTVEKVRVAVLPDSPS